MEIYKTPFQSLKKTLMLHNESAVSNVNCKTFGSFRFSCTQVPDEGSGSYEM